MAIVMFVYHRLQDINVLNWPVGTIIEKRSLNLGQVHGAEHSQLIKLVCVNVITMHFCG